MKIPLEAIQNTDICEQSLETDSLCLINTGMEVNKTHIHCNGCTRYNLCYDVDNKPYTLKKFLTKYHPELLL